MTRVCDKKQQEEAKLVKPLLFERATRQHSNAEIEIYIDKYTHHLTHYDKGTPCTCITAK